MPTLPTLPPESPKLYFASDHHFGHKRICELAGRPWADWETMGDALVAAHNDVVRDDRADVYFLGDVAFSTAALKRWVPSMRGRKHLIVGNHDKKINKSVLAATFETVRDYHELRVPDPFGGAAVKLVLFHFPIASWNRRHYGAIHLHGHSHGHYNRDPGRILDIGVDCVDGYRPIGFVDVLRRVMDRPIGFVDQHEPE